MRKWIILGIAALLWTSVADARQPGTRREQPVKKVPEAEAEKETAYSAFIVVEAGTGNVLEGENTHLKWPPASIAKLMVASIVMEKVAKGELPLTEKIKISREASKMGGSQVYLKEGETFSLEELMKATLVASGNDAAYAIAEHIAGSAERFVAMMNERAKALNMQDTEFHSVHGLPPSSGQREDLTSCYDLALVARDLVKHPKLLEWTSIQTESFREGTFIMNNHNKLLGRMSGVDGLKTGYYRKAGYNVVVTARKGGLRLVAVVLGSSTAKIRDRVAEEKLKKYFAAFDIVNLVNKGDVMDKEIMVPNGKTRRIKGIASESFSYLVPASKKGAIKRELNLPEKVDAEIKQGQPLGEMVFRLDNEVIGRVGIVSPVDVPKAGFFSRLMRMLGLGS